MITQRRRTAGIRLLYGDSNVHVDPGPGALIFSNWARLSPQRLEGVVVTHCHPDHYSDAEVLIEAMSHGTRDKRGLIAAPKSVLYGNEYCDPSISRYHRNLAAKVVRLEPGYLFEIGGLSFTAVEARHSEPDGVGLRIETPDLGALGYTSDTSFFPDLGYIFRNLRLLIACSMWPRNEYLKFHLSTDEVLELVNLSKPKCIVLTHFGMKMLNSDPDSEASYLETETDIPTFAAKDGMKVELSEDIKIIGPRKSDEPRIIDA